MANKPHHPAYGDASNKRTTSGEVPQARAAVDDMTPDLSKRGVVARAADGNDWSRAPGDMPDVTRQMGAYGEDFGNVGARVSPRIVMPSKMLMGFRHNHPFVPVYNLPMKCVSAVLDGANAQYMNVPENAIAVMFSQTLLATTSCLINFSGVAQGPANLDLGGTIPLPVGLLFYCYGAKQFSIFSPTANTIVGAMFYQSDASEMN